MPMNTTFETLSGTAARRATNNCSTISPTERFRPNPICPVAQNEHAIAQPAWVETHTVARLP